MKILIKISGSISAYKVCHVVSSLVKEGHEVKVAASRSALEFVGSSTWEALSKNQVYSDDFEEGRRLDHIFLNDWAELVVLAPTSAQTLNSLASGVGSSCLTTLFLSRKVETPYLVFPAMNPRMWGHSRVRESVSSLETIEGVKVFSPSEGVMACGHEGSGRLPEPFEILNEIYNCQKGERILITLGGTFESVDGVREVSNFSSGKTGLELVKSMRSKFKVEVLASKKTKALLKEEFGFSVNYFTGVKDLSQKMEKFLSENHYTKIFHLAAVSDYTIKKEIDKKIDSSAENMAIDLTKAPKILNNIREWSKNKEIDITSFKLTHNQSEEEINFKISSQFKSSDSNRIVHNELSDIDDGKHIFKILNKKMEVMSHGENKEDLVKALTRGSL